MGINSGVDRSLLLRVYDAILTGLMSRLSFFQGSTA